MHPADPTSDGTASTRPAASTKPRRSRTDTREALIRCGTELCSERGFQVTGIDEVLKRVGVPKGSFYHHFETKHHFGQAVIDNYANYFRRKLEKTLGDGSKPPLERLRSFVQEARQGMTKFKFQRGCLIGNMGQELGGLDEAFRAKLEVVLLSWQAATEVCLHDAVAQGQLAPTVDVRKMAAFFWIGWEGAILRSKLTRNTDPLDLFTDMFFALLERQDGTARSAAA